MLCVISSCVTMASAFKVHPIRASRNWRYVEKVFLVNAGTTLTYYFVDHDECVTGNHTCGQRCVNHPGGYTCTCLTGFSLNNDNRTCSGKIKIL